MEYRWPIVLESERELGSASSRITPSRSRGKAGSMRQITAAGLEYGEHGHDHLSRTFEAQPDDRIGNDAAATQFVGQLIRRRLSSEVCNPLPSPNERLGLRHGQPLGPPIGDGSTCRFGDRRIALTAARARSARRRSKAADRLGPDSRWRRPLLTIVGNAPAMRSIVDGVEQIAVVFEDADQPFGHLGQTER